MPWRTHTCVYVYVSREGKGGKMNRAIAVMNCRAGNRNIEPIAMGYRLEVRSGHHATFYFQFEPLE